MLLGVLHQSDPRGLKGCSRPPFAYQECIHVYLTLSIRADQTCEVDHASFLSSFTLSIHADHIGEVDVAQTRFNNTSSASHTRVKCVRIERASNALQRRFKRTSNAMRTHLIRVSNVRRTNFKRASNERPTHFKRASLRHRSTSFFQFARTRHVK